MFKAVYLDFVHRRSLVDMVTRIWGVESENLSVISGGRRNFSLLHTGPEVGSAQLLLHRVPGTLSAGIKRLELESDQLIKFLSRG
jgi:hypothetical protein